jgi:hypothetical protein
VIDVMNKWAGVVVTIEELRLAGKPTGEAEEALFEDRIATGRSPGKFRAR